MEGLNGTKINIVDTEYLVNTLITTKQKVFSEGIAVTSMNAMLQVLIIKFLHLGGYKGYVLKQTNPWDKRKDCISMKMGKRLITDGMINIYITIRLMVLSGISKRMAHSTSSQ